jgi:subtilisin family serine protease
LTEGKSADQLKLSPTLDKLSRKHKVRSIKPIIENFKAKRQRVENLKKKDKGELTKKEKHLLKRLKRAPKGVKVPSLERIYQIELQTGQLAPLAAADYAEDSDVEYVSLNYALSMCATPDDPNYPVQWALNNTGQNHPYERDYTDPNLPRWGWPPGTPDCDIDAPEAWDICTGSSEVIVAVIDTGVDYGHQDLQNNLWQNPDETPDNGVDDDDNGYIDDIYGYDFCTWFGEARDSDPNDDNGHGTHCAGTIAADSNNNLDVAGVCWSAKIMAVKIIHSSGWLWLSDAVRGIEYAVDNGADITSNSWGGGGYYKPLEDIIDYAYSQGVITVAAAGNVNNDTPFYPAYYDNAIAVAATDHNDVKASFSKYGDRRTLI